MESKVYPVHILGRDRDNQLPEVILSNNNYEKNTKESRLWKPGKSEVHQIEMYVYGA